MSVVVGVGFGASGMGQLGGFYTGPDPMDPRWTARIELTAVRVRPRRCDQSGISPIRRLRIPQSPLGGRTYERSSLLQRIASWIAPALLRARIARGGRDGREDDNRASAGIRTFWPGRLASGEDDVLFKPG